MTPNSFVLVIWSTLLFGILLTSNLQPKFSAVALSNAPLPSTTRRKQCTSSRQPFYSVRLQASTQGKPTRTAPSAFSPSQENVQLAARLGVRPARLDFFPPWFWRFCWRLHGRLLPYLHSFDQARTRDLENCLKCLWCKALIGLNPKSPAYDAGLAYDMLPSGTRWVARLPSSFYPRLVHYIIELRTVFLDRALGQEIQRVLDGDQDCKIRLVTLGCGYDTRSVKFLNAGTLNEAWELDMQPVVESKSIMYERLQTRRRCNQMPTLVVQDLTDLKGLEQVLDRIMTVDTKDGDSSGRWYTIFLVEGVLIYLKEEQRSNLLSFCSSYLRGRPESQRNGSFLFADRIRKPRDPDLEQIQSWLQIDGWVLLDDTFCVHPGKARHMGVARLTST